MKWTKGTIATAVLLALGFLASRAGWLTPAGGRAETDRPMPPPGGDVPITREKLSRTYVDAISGSHLSGRWRSSGRNTFGLAYSGFCARNPISPPGKGTGP